MSVEKYWAYLDENSHNKINAREVLELEGREPGRWKHNRVYYSTHLPVQRLLMWHRRSHTGTCSFVYQPGQDEEIERLGGGESLTHYLFKVAISELSSTLLKIKRYADIPINIQKSIIEKKFSYNGKNYFVDVFCEFASNGSLELKWDGRLGMEVNYQHALEEEKIGVLKELEIPVVEISISDKFIYRVEDENSTPALERRYIDFIKRNLSEYMFVELLSNPSTKEFLKKEVKYLNQKVSDLSSQISKAGNELAAVSKKNNELGQENNNLQDKNKELKSLLEKNGEELTDIKNMGVFKFGFLKFREFVIKKFG